MASIATTFNNVIIQEANKGNTWNGDVNYNDISDVTSNNVSNVTLFAEKLLAFGNKLVNENKRKITIYKKQPKSNYNFMNDLSESLKTKILTNMDELITIIKENDNNKQNIEQNVIMIDMLARFIMRERAISSGSRADEGKGHRIISFYMMVIFIEAFANNKNIITLLPHYGCYRDLNALIGYYYSTNYSTNYSNININSMKYHIDMVEYILDIYAKAINDDIKIMIGEYTNHSDLYSKIKKLYNEDNKGKFKISMAGKWFPRQSSEFGVKRQEARKEHDLDPEGIHHKRYTNHRNMLISKVFFPDEESNYLSTLDQKKQNFYEMTMRRILTIMNNVLNVTETRMANNEWDKIEPSSIPAGALYQHRKALLNEIVNDTQSVDDNGGRTTDEARIALRHKLIKSSLDNALKGATLDCVKFANTIFGSCRLKSFSKSERLVIHSQFLALVEDIRCRIMKEHKDDDDFDPLNVIATIDVSGSMSTANVMGPAIVLGIIITLISKLGRCFLTFDDIPTVINLEKDGDIIDWVTQVSRAPWGGSTNMDGALDRLLDIMKKVRNQNPEFDGKINHVILTDGQFNSTFCTFGENNWDTFAERMIKKFNDNGFCLPRTTFWNLNHKSPGFPATSHMEGMILAEGLSQGLMLSVLGNAVSYKNNVPDFPNINPLEAFLKSIYRSDFDLVSSTLFN